MALEHDDFDLAAELTAVLKRRKDVPKPAPKPATVIAMAGRRKTPQG